jgi:hypothetical protein
MHPASHVCRAIVFPGPAREIKARAITIAATNDIELILIDSYKS